MGSRIEGEEVETLCVVKGSYLFDKGNLCASENDSEGDKVLMLEKGGS